MGCSYVQEQWQPCWNQWACLMDALALGCMVQAECFLASRPAWISGGPVFKPLGNSLHLFLRPGICGLVIKPEKASSCFSRSVPPCPLASWPGNRLLCLWKSCVFSGAFPVQIHTNKYHIGPALPWALVSRSAPGGEDPCAPGPLLSTVCAPHEHPRDPLAVCFATTHPLPGAAGRAGRWGGRHD